MRSQYNYDWSICPHLPMIFLNGTFGSVVLILIVKRPLSSSSLQTKYNNKYLHRSFYCLAWIHFITTFCKENLFLLLVTNVLYRKIFLIFFSNSKCHYNIQLKQSGFLSLVSDWWMRLQQKHILRFRFNPFHKIVTNI